MKITKVDWKRLRGVFDTVLDVINLMLGLAYILFTAVLTALDIGETWYHVAMFSISFAYIVFFIIKIVSNNKVFGGHVTKHYTIKVLKYSKWAMKLINVVLIVLSIATTRFNTESVLMILSVVFICVTFAISLFIEIAWFFVRRSFHILYTDLVKAPKSAAAND
jgi:hypothetical protein